MRSALRRPTPIVIPPGRITAITPSARAAGRFDLVIDGEPAARLGIEAIERLALHVGGSVTEALAASIGEEAGISRAYDRAISMLAVRGRATAELRRLLLKKGEPPRTVTQVVHRLEAAGFLDDAAFSRQFTRWKATAGGLSRRRIAGELARRGIDRETAASAIDETFADEGVDEIAGLERVAERKLRTMSRVEPERRRRRLYGFLARRGYDADDIGAVVKRLTRE
jgi:regulatory protein